MTVTEQATDADGAQCQNPKLVTRTDPPRASCDLPSDVDMDNKATIQNDQTSDLKQLVELAKGAQEGKDLRAALRSIRVSCDKATSCMEWCEAALPAGVFLQAASSLDSDNQEVADEASGIFALTGNLDREDARKFRKQLTQSHGKQWLDKTLNKVLGLLNRQGLNTATSHSHAISTLGWGASSAQYSYCFRDPDKVDLEPLLAWILRNGKCRSVPVDTYLEAWEVITKNFDCEYEELYVSQGEDGDKQLLDLSPLLDIALDDLTKLEASRALDICEALASPAAEAKPAIEQCIELLRRGSHELQALQILFGMVDETFILNKTDRIALPMIVEAGGLPLLVALLNPDASPDEFADCSPIYNSTSVTVAAIGVLKEVLEDKSALAALESLIEDFCQRLFGLFGALKLPENEQMYALLLCLMHKATESPPIANKLRHKGALMTALSGIRLGCTHGDRETDVHIQAPLAFEGLIDGEAGSKAALEAGAIPILVDFIKNAKALHKEAEAVRAIYGDNRIPYKCSAWESAAPKNENATSLFEGASRCLDAMTFAHGRNSEAMKRKIGSSIVQAGVLPMLVECLGYIGIESFYGWVLLDRLADLFPDRVCREDGLQAAVLNALGFIPQLTIKRNFIPSLGAKVSWCLSVAVRWIDTVENGTSDCGIVPALVGAIRATALKTADCSFYLGFNDSVLEQLLESAEQLFTTLQTDEPKDAFLQQLIRDGVAAHILSWESSESSEYDFSELVQLLKDAVKEAAEHPYKLLYVTAPEHQEGAMFGLAAASAALHASEGCSEWAKRTNKLLRRPGFSEAAANAMLQDNKPGEIARTVFSKHWSALAKLAAVPPGTKRLRQDKGGAEEVPSKRSCINREHFNVKSFDTLQLMVGGKPFYGHGVVLRSASETLAAALQDLTPEAVLSPISLGDGPSAVPADRLHSLFCAACEHAYFGAVPGLALDGPIPVFELREVAQWLQMPALLDECTRFIASALHEAESVDRAVPLMEMLYREFLADGLLPPVYIKDIGIKGAGLPRSNYFKPAGPAQPALASSLLRWAADDRVAKILTKGMGGALDKPRRARCVRLLSDALKDLDGFRLSLGAALL